MSQPTKSSWLVDFSKHMGRVGALAVAVGIGSALTAPHVAWADDGAPGGAPSADAGTGGAGGAPASEPKSASPTPTGTTTGASTPGTEATEPTGTPEPKSPTGAGEPKSTKDSGDPVSEGSDRRATRHSRRDSLRATARLARAKTAAAHDAPDPAKQPPTSDTPTAEPATAPVTAPAGAGAQVTVATTEVTTAVAPTQSAPAPGIRTLVLGMLGVFGFSPNPVPGHTNNPLLEAIWAGYRRIETLFDDRGTAITATVHTGLRTATTPGAAGDPVIIDADRQDASASAAVELPTVTATITQVNPAPSRPSSPLRTFVLNALGAFGFDPEPGHANNPVLQAIWNGYRKLEAIFDNIAPDIDAVRILGTRLTDDGYVAVDLAVDVSDYDGDPISTSTITGVAFTKNLDGTFTYLAAPGYSGTDTVYIGATDSGNHYHQGTTIFDYTGKHTRVAAIAITVTAAPALSAS